ncbi:MAG: ABC transporter permease [Lachnospiraceae bacterium]|nr:ABC transporter permease [Lachnospiraceae bacterium]
MSRPAKKTTLWQSEGFQSFASSLICVLLGLLIGYIVLLIINPKGAWGSIVAILKNFMTYSRANLRLKNLGSTLVKTAPLLMCSLSILFCYKVGLFNIGAAGQYEIGALVSLYAALAWKQPWWVCVLLAVAAGMIYGGIVGALKAYCNVNEVISGIMLNWIGLYLTNMVLSKVKDPASPYTLHLSTDGPQARLPQIGLNKLFANNAYVSIAIPLTIVIAIAIKIILDKTRFGFELKATGFNKDASKYAGMAEKRNIIVTLAIGGALAAMGAALLYLADYEQWTCTSTTVPGMGFNGIAAAFLGGLNPVGVIFSSYFIQHITAGGAFVDKTLYSSQISDLISAIIIYLCGFVGFIKLMMKKSAKKNAAPADMRFKPEELKEIQKGPSAANSEKGGKE